MIKNIFTRTISYKKYEDDQENHFFFEMMSKFYIKKLIDSKESFLEWSIKKKKVIIVLTKSQILNT